MAIGLRRARPLLFASALAGASLLGQLALSAPAARASAPAPNQRVAVQGSISAQALPGVEAFGTTPAASPETVSFVLQEQNLPQLQRQVESGVRNFLSVSQFADAFGQSPDYISQLQRYLSSFGITTDVYPDRVDVVASGTAGAFDQALSVQQRQYYVPGHPGRGGTMGAPAQYFHGVSQSPKLPYRVAQGVLAILGLTNYAPFTSQAQHIASVGISPQQGSSNSCVALTGLTSACNLPSNFAQNYGLTPLYRQGAEGQGQTVGIVTLAALDQGAPEYFWQNVLGMTPSSRTVTVDNVDGGPGAPSGASGSAETDLDVEQSGALAPDANVIVYQAPNTDYGFADAFFSAASQNLASSVSASWGGSETAIADEVASGEESPGYQAAFDEAFLEMAEQGQSAFSASGDEGAYTASADLGTTNLSVTSPADSPFVTAAGGTTLPWSVTLTGPGGSATVSVTQQRTWGWDYLWQPIATVTGDPLAAIAESEVVGSGGGFSQVERAPSYQQDIPGTRFYSAVQYLTPTDYQEVAPGLWEPTSWNFNPTPQVSRGVGQGRALPDISADADPYSGYLEYSPSFAGNPIEGGWGGTSFVAPQLNGSTAVIDSYLGRRVGFLNPQVYPLATQRNSPFTPLEQSGTQSDNIYYTGTPGQPYNQGSGLGYPNLSQLAQGLR